MGEKQERPKWIWCLVGNVVKERPYGPNHEVRRGTKRFAPGTKVYCYPVKWGDGYERIYVLGKPREKYDLIRLIMPRKYIENFRLQRVYNPQVIERMNPSLDSEDYVDGWDDSDFDRMEIKHMLTWLNLSEEESDRRFTVMSLSSLVLESHIEGCPEGGVSLRIERRHRTDSLYGGAWYGFCSIGGGPEHEIGMLDWYGTWPDEKPYVFGQDIHDDMDLAFGLCDAGIHLWKETYDAPANYGGPGYSWSIRVGEDDRSFSCSGRNAHPDTLPSVYRLLAAWGFPSIWDSGSDAPCAQLID